MVHRHAWYRATLVFEDGETEVLTSHNQVDLVEAVYDLRRSYWAKLMSVSVKVLTYQDAEEAHEFRPVLSVDGWAA